MVLSVSTTEVKAGNDEGDGAGKEPRFPVALVLATTNSGGEQVVPSLATNWL